MSSHAGPSSSSKANGSSKKAKATEPTAPSRSREAIESEEDESSSEAEGEPDSEGDLEDIQPTRRAISPAHANGVTREPGAGWPRYAPPSGMTPINVSTQYTESPFEWDALARRPNVQLWAVRVPADFKPKHLASLQLSNPSSSSTSSSSGGRIGSLKTKHRAYNLVPAGHTSKTRTAVNSEGRDPTSGPSAVDAMRMDADHLDEEDLRREGGEEMQGMSLMLPRLSKKGKLFVAPKPITRHLILEPDTSSSATEMETSTLPSYLSTGHEPVVQAPTLGSTKRVQPTHLFKFRNNTVGINTPGPNGLPESQRADKTMLDVSVEKKKKRKSEKGESGTPKKKSKV